LSARHRAAAAAILACGRGQARGPGISHVVRNAEGRIVLAGQIPVGSDGSFQLDLRSKLPEGRFTLAAQIIVNGNAMNAEIRNFPIDTR